MATSAECDGDGQFRGRSVTIIAAIVVFIVRRPPQGQSSRWREATSKDRRKTTVMNNDDMCDDPRSLLSRSLVELGGANTTTNL